MKVLLTGATGFIGKEIGKALVRKGHQVFALSRNAEKARQVLPFPAQILEGNFSQGPLDHPELQTIEAVIHLAGENVGEGRWTDERKKIILSSRLESTEYLIQSLPPSVKVFISASAIGYYGNRKDEELNETSLKGLGFLSDVCEKWENSVLQGKHKISSGRFVILRTGLVLSPFGGAFVKMLTPFQMRLGGVLGSGRQWMSWIHMKDLVNMYLEALENPKFQGIYNAVAPEPVTNSTWTNRMAMALGVSKGPPAPAFALKLLLGEMAELLLDSQKVTSAKLKDFRFEFPSLQEAMSDVCSHYRDGDQIFYSEQYFPLEREKVFSFFSKAENLEAITPPILSFKVLSCSTAQVQQGTLIDYRLQLHGVPLKWRTLIKEWNPSEHFVDIQLKGPYKKWHHRHDFENLGSGTLMTDIVRYKLPLGPLGQAVGGHFVQGDVEKIFGFRRKTVPGLLGK